MKNIYFPENNVYIFEDHNWAFAAWESFRLQNKIRNATLIHVDGHLDDVPDGTQVEGLFDINSEEDCFKVASKLKVDNFIWPGIATDAIQHPIYISHMRYGRENINKNLHVDYNLETDRVMYETIRRKDCTAYRVNYVEDFKYHLDSHSFYLEKHFLNNKQLILDLDLDYFNDTNDMLNSSIMEEERIRENLAYLKEMFEWELITVSLSPLYCGGVNNCEYLLNLFLEVFELDTNQALDIQYIK